MIETALVLSIIAVGLGIYAAFFKKSEQITVEEVDSEERIDELQEDVEELKKWVVEHGQILRNSRP